MSVLNKSFLLEHDSWIVFDIVYEFGKSCSILLEKKGFYIPSLPKKGALKKCLKEVKCNYL